MLKYKISEIISNIDEEYICEATDYVRVKSRRFLNWIKGKVWILGLVVLIVLGVKFIPVLLGNIFEKEPEKLVICTDEGTYEEVKGAVDRWRALGREYSTSIQTEIVKIPKDEAAAQIKIAEIRTEIMAGGGPDLFILHTNLPMESVEERMTSLLFSNPEKTLYTEIFLPLDEYLDDFEYLNTENCNQVVLKAGQTDEGQLLLPIIYTYFACIFPDQENENEMPFPDSWEDISTSESMKRALLHQGFLSFLAYSGPYADYEKEKLIVSENDILAQFELLLSGQKAWKDVTVRDVGNLHFLQRELGNSNEETHTFYAVPNIAGGVTANICVYAGINRNTKLAQEAASLLDTFCELTKLNEFFSDYGIYIEQDEYMKKIYRLNYGILEEDIESFFEMNDKISDARFFSTWDCALWDEFLAQNRKNPKPLEQVVKELYQTMQMELKE